MQSFIDYFQHLTLFGKSAIIIVAGLIILAIYSQVRKRRSTEN